MRLTKKIINIELFISLFVKLSILAVFISSLVEKQWMTAFASLIILFASFLPSLMKRRYKLFLPPEFEIIISLFLYATFILGEMRGYYTNFWWWDVLLHSFSAFIFGITGFVIIYTIHFVQKIKMSPSIAALFSFNFAIMIGVIWEIIEFGADQLLGLHMQKSGIVDTMWDLIVDCVGGLVGATIGYFYLKGGDSLIIQRLVQKFVRANFKSKDNDHEIFDDDIKDID